MNNQATSRCPKSPATSAHLAKRLAIAVGCVAVTIQLLSAAPARAGDCEDVGKSFSMLRQMYDGCPGWRLTELGIRRFSAVGSELGRVGGDRCVKLGGALMYRSLAESNPQISKLAEAKDLAGFSAAVCDTLAERFELISVMAGLPPVVEKGVAGSKPSAQADDEAAKCLPVAEAIAAKLPAAEMKAQSERGVTYTISDMPGSKLVVSCSILNRAQVEDVELQWDGASLTKDKAIEIGARLAAVHTDDNAAMLIKLSNRCLATAAKAQERRFQAIDGKTTLSCRIASPKGFSLSFFQRGKKDYEN